MGMEYLFKQDDFEMVQYDCVVVSAPALVSGLAGYGFAKLEEKKNYAVRCVGFLGLRISMVTFHLTSLATIIYAVFRSIILNTLNVVTFKTIKCLRSATLQTDEMIRLMFTGGQKKPFNAPA